jgi:hypothetical protein
MMLDSSCAVRRLFAQLVNMLSLNAHRFGQRGLYQPHGCMNSSTRTSPTVAGLSFVVSMGRLIGR